MPSRTQLHNQLRT